MVKTLIASTLADPLLVGLVSTLLTGGLVTAWAAAKRAKPQAELDTITGMKMLLIEVREELDRAHEKTTRLEHALVVLEKDRDDWKQRALAREVGLE